MARNATADRAKAKAKKQKQLAIALTAVLVVLVAIQGPKTMKMLKGAPSAPSVVASSTAPATTTPAGVAPAPATAPGAAATATPGQLVSAVQATPDAGQLREFNRFASKDPFAAQVDPSAAAAPQGGTAVPASAPKAQAAPKAPAAPPPTSAVISLNGELMAVVVNGAFPTSGTTFNRVGSLFQLVSLTRTSAKVTVVGGSYANGAPALTLAVGKPVTLQNTADGTRYTLVLEPQGTQLPPPVATTAPAPITPPATAPVVPAGSGG